MHWNAYKNIYTTKNSSLITEKHLDEFPDKKMIDIKSKRTMYATEIGESANFEIYVKIIPK